MILNFVRELSSGKGTAKLGTMRLSAADSLIGAAVILLRSRSVCNEIAALTRG
jgi:hypothetical protein